MTGGGSLAAIAQSSSCFTTQFLNPFLAQKVFCDYASLPINRTFQLLADLEMLTLPSFRILHKHIQEGFLCDHICTYLNCYMERCGLPSKDLPLDKQVFMPESRQPSWNSHLGRVLEIAHLQSPGRSFQPPMYFLCVSSLSSLEDQQKLKAEVPWETVRFKIEGNQVLLGYLGYIEK